MPVKSKTNTQESNSLATIKDVANKAGVSLTTASAALHKTGRISEQRRIQIMKIARDIGYQPRTAARLMRSKNTGHLGLVLNQVDPLTAFKHGNHRHYIAHFIKACEQRNIPYHLDFCDISNKQKTLPRHASGGLVDGILVLGDDVDMTQSKISPMHHWLTDTFSKPAITLSSQCNWSILSDAEEGVVLALRELYKLGHRKVGFVSGSQPIKYNKKHAMGFKRGVNELGMTTHEHWQIASKVSTMNTAHVMDAVLQEALQVLGRDDRPTAIYCNGGEKMRAVIEAARLANINVPHELSVIGNCSSIYAEDGYPRLSGVHTDVPTIINQALDMLLRCIKSPKTESQAMKIIPQIVLRQTTSNCNI